MKSLNHKKIGPWQKISLFFKTRYFGFAASLIALITWWVEKVNVEESRGKISEFFRIESEIHQLQTANVIFQVETSSTLRNQKDFINDSIFHSAFSPNVQNEVQQEINCIYTFQRQSDLEGEMAKEFDDEKAAKEKELQAILKTGNFNIMKGYVTRKRTEFSAKLPQLQSSFTGNT